ncbi:hypothetical protein B0H66DRAFT_244790 [Apodospora peruviana]|uniref:Uncharacterized protein n=1 Tax=Apodospora peruviana TaxID=516989 RepID=A0AAE0M475_9PEZI|nr:hypothetical protein B0H66DRAFT_244790 [Apodospora peruviana]
MPPVNQAVLASAGIIAVSVAVAAAIAVYESPEIRRMAEDLRRRIAIALHSLGDNVDPGRQDDPLFNRPEDAEGFLQSRGVLGADQGVEADEETKRRQREELMYWNARREEMEEKKRRESQQQPRRSLSRASTFDDFLQEDKMAVERGTFVYNTGADVWGSSGVDQGVVRRRGPLEGVRGLNASMVANAFGDEFGIELDDRHDMAREAEAESARLLSPGHDEIMSDIYDATPRDGRSTVSHTISPRSKPVVPDVLFDFDSQPRSGPATTVEQEDSRPPSMMEARSVTLERELADDEYMTAGQEDRQDAHASIQAWAQGSKPSFYSPLPESPAAPLSVVSEPEVISTGDLTPTDSASLAGSGEDIGNYATSSKDGDYDVLSEDGDGVATPNSWSEVGSQVSESDSAVRA